MKRLLFIILIAASMLAACGAKASENRSLDSSGNQYGGAAPETGGVPSFAPVPQQPAAEAPAAGGGGEAAAIERLVIQNADLAIVVSDVEARMKALEAMAVEMGGYVVSSNKYQTSTRNGGEAPEAQVVLRIPAEKLDEALNRIKADVVEVQSELRSGQDVTAEYVDLQSRLKNLEATEAQLVKIMENATATEDVCLTSSTSCPPSVSRSRWSRAR